MAAPFRWLQDSVAPPPPSLPPSPLPNGGGCYIAGAWGLGGTLSLLLKPLQACI